MNPRLIPKEAVLGIASKLCFYILFPRCYALQLLLVDILSPIRQRRVVVDFVTEDCYPDAVKV